MIKLEHGDLSGMKSEFQGVRVPMCGFIGFFDSIRHFLLVPSGSIYLEFRNNAEGHSK